MNWLRNLFKKKEKGKKVVAINELDKWLVENANSIFKELNKSIEMIYEKIKEEIKQIGINLNILKEVEIRKDIGTKVREKQAVLGNKEAYINHVNLFLKKIKIPLKGSYEEALNFCSSFEDALKDLMKHSAKSYYITQYLLGEKVSNVAKNLKKLDLLVVEIKKKVKEKEGEVSLFEETKEKIKRLQEEITAKEKIERELKKENLRIEELKELQKNIGEEISEIEKSKEWEKINEDKKKKIEINKEIKQIENQVIDLFSVLGKALKKEKKINLAGEKILEFYINAPVEALIDDTDFKIITLLNEMEKHILTNNIELKEKKKEKTLKVLREISKDFLKDLVVRYTDLKDSKEQIEESILANEIIRKNDSLSNKIQDIDNKTVELTERIENLNQEKGKINLDSRKEEIENILNKVADVKVEIR